MGFFSGIRRRIKKIIPKEIRPAIPFIASALIPGPASSGLFKSAIGNQFMAAAAAKAATDDEADLKDIFRTGAIAAAPTAIEQGLAGVASRTSNKALAEMATKGAEYIRNTDGKGLTGIKKVGGQTALDFGIKQAELNEKAIAEYEADLLARGIRDKAKRRTAIFDIFVGAGYDADETNAMLDKYGYADGGKVRTMTPASMKGGLDKYYDMLEKLKKKKKKRGEKANGCPNAVSNPLTACCKFDPIFLSYSSCSEVSSNSSLAIFKASSFACARGMPCSTNLSVIVATKLAALGSILPPLAFSTLFFFFFFNFSNMS